MAEEEGIEPPSLLQPAAFKAVSSSIRTPSVFWVTDGIRTHDTRHHKPMLYHWTTVTESIVGIEPTNNSFADCPFKPLRHMDLYSIILQNSFFSLVLEDYKFCASSRTRTYELKWERVYNPLQLPLCDTGIFVFPVGLEPTTLCM